MNLIIKLSFLLLLLFCPKSYAVCNDPVGNDYFCSPTVFSEKQVNSSCSCPCEEKKEEKECEEYEVTLEVHPSKNIETTEASKIFTLIATSFSNYDIFDSKRKIVLRHSTLNGLDPTSFLRRVMLKGVVILQ
jgi:hypothetical protein